MPLLFSLGQHRALVDHPADEKCETRQRLGIIVAQAESKTSYNMRNIHAHSVLFPLLCVFDVLFFIVFRVFVGVVVCLNLFWCFSFFSVQGWYVLFLFFCRSPVCLCFSPVSCFFFVFSVFCSVLLRFDFLFFSSFFPCHCQLATPYARCFLKLERIRPASTWP